MTQPILEIKDLSISYFTRAGEASAVRDFSLTINPGGGMINESRNMILFAPHTSVFPCIAISSLALGFNNFLADGIREISMND